MSVDYHESLDVLDERTKNIARALSSLKEEIEAVNWYNQRVAASDDETLKAILAHNRDEEIEHACMALEWLRRNMPEFDAQLRTYLFKDAPITELEGEQDEPSGSNPVKSGTGLSIGSMKNK